jgi:hypothetical protein
MEIQYLRGYKKTSNGETLLNNPIWRRLTREVMESSPEGNNFLCRLVPYENLSLDIKANKNSFDNCYDQYFIISANKIKEPVNIEANKIKNMFIEKIINDIQIQVPSMIIEPFNKIDKKRNIPQIIKISEINTDLIPESIPKIFKDDMKKVSKVKNSNKIVPVSSKLLAHALSIDSQNKNASNDIKNNNYIPSTNIKNSLNKNKGIKK